MPLGGLGRILMDLRRRLYLYVAIDMIVAILMGKWITISGQILRYLSVVAVFLMLYPMMIRLAIERLKSSAKNYRLIGASLLYAYGIGPLVAYLVASNLLTSFPELYAALILVGTIPCSNMLIGWSGIAGASVEDALVVAVIGLLTIPFLSPPLTGFLLGSSLQIDVFKLFIALLGYILIPMVLGYYTRKVIMVKRGRSCFNSLKEVLPGFSALGILLIVFMASLKSSRIVLREPIILGLIAVSLLMFYAIQTALALLGLKIFRFKYETGFIFLLAAVARSQAVSLAVAATLFGALTTLAISFKPILQVAYILTLIYPLGGWLRKFMGMDNQQM